MDRLSHATLEIFEKEKSPLLGLFYKCCFVLDFSKELILPNKGTVSKVNAGELNKKTHSPLLLKLAFYAQFLPVIGLILVMPAIKIPRMLIKPPAVITFETTTSRDLEDTFDL